MSIRRLLCLIVVLGFSCILASGESRAAEPLCSDRVLADWFDDGRVDRVYPLACYEEAIAAMPTDIRDYTDARDVIGRALTSALRGRSGAMSAEEQVPLPQAEGAIDATGTSTLPLPLPLVALFGLALTVLAAGALSHLARTRRDR